ncbi:MULTISPECIES: hypothetical protein, partial [unclassified Mesorhizobium]|jgi:hypothetical protein|uniref:hypothetical protein n=2 Tax=Mesorhizobium TaxID=68287 RepID=UPI0019CFD07D
MFSAFPPTLFCARLFLNASGARASTDIVAFNRRFGNGATGTACLGAAMTESTMFRVCDVLFFVRCAVYE